SCATRFPARARRNRRSRSPEAKRPIRHVLQFFGVEAAAKEFHMPTAAPASKTATPKAAPAPNGDFYQLVDLLAPGEKALVKKVRTYMETKVQPVINKYWSDDAFPFELLP